MFSALPDITTLVHRNPERGAVQRLRERYVDGPAKVWPTHARIHARAHRILTELELPTDVTDLSELHQTEKSEVEGHNGSDRTFLNRNCSDKTV